MRRLAPDRYLLVGEAPSRTGSADPDHALTGRPLARMLAWSGLTMQQHVAAFDRRNLLAAWPGAAGQGSAWDRGPARAAAIALLTAPAQPAAFLLLGRRVAAAFGLAPAIPWYASGAGLLRGAAPGARWVVLPHPSGVSHHWNDSAARAEFGTFLRGCWRAWHHGPAWPISRPAA